MGGDIAVQTFDHHPDKHEINQLEESIGGMTCIKSSVFELNDFGEYCYHIDDERYCD